MKPGSTVAPCASKSRVPGPRGRMGSKVIRRPLSTIRSGAGIGHSIAGSGRCWNRRPVTASGFAPRPSGQGRRPADRSFGRPIMGPAKLQDRQIGPGRASPAKMRVNAPMRDQRMNRLPGVFAAPRARRRVLLPSPVLLVADHSTLHPAVIDPQPACSSRSRSTGSMSLLPHLGNVAAPAHRFACRPEMPAHHGPPFWGLESRSPGRIEQVHGS